MRFLLRLSLCCLVAGGVAMAQRGGGGARGAGGGGRGMGGGGRIGGGGFVGGGRGGFIGGGRGGFVGRGFGRGFDRDDFFRGGFGFPNLGYYPYWGFGLGLGPDYYDYPYDVSPYSSYPYANGYGGYASYQPSPNVTVIYPQQPVVAAPPRPAQSVIKEYDQNGEEIRQNGSPLYLIAFNDHTIRAALSYQVDGNTLHYVTTDHQDKQAPLDTVDRALSLQLNRERRVPFQLPPQ